ncbi:flavin-containing monooxygenase [Spirillospora sp. NPDC127200]
MAGGSTGQQDPSGGQQVRRGTAARSTTAPQRRCRRGRRPACLGGRTFSAPLVVAATGAFSRPHRPDLPGLAGFPGQVLHSARYRSPQGLEGRRIVVVGGGNSAVQIAIELAVVARVILATRHPLRFVPQTIAGRDAHLWLRRTGLDGAGWARPLLTGGKGAPVFDTGAYRAQIATGNPDRRPLFTRIDGDQVVWADGSREQVEAVLLATGYRPGVDYLADLGALDDQRRPLHRGGLSLTHRGLGYVGLEWQRSFASATLRGVGADARHVLKRLLKRHHRPPAQPPVRAGRPGGQGGRRVR